jgi:hypothetical protein
LITLFNTGGGYAQGNTPHARALYTRDMRTLFPTKRRRKQLTRGVHRTSSRHRSLIMIKQKTGLVLTLVVFTLVVWVTRVTVALF